MALVAFCCGSFYLGPIVSFFNLLINDVNISSNLYYILSYFWMPIGAMSITVMALNVFKPEYQKYLIIFWGIVSIIYWIFMFGFTDQQHIASTVGTGELLDISHQSVSLYISGLGFIMILVINTGGFLFLGLKLKSRDFPKRDVWKSFMISIGWFLFVISGVMDALFPPESIGFIIFVRGLMMIAFNLIYLGFWSKPKRLEDSN